jgi:hypothetical protein
MYPPIAKAAHITGKVVVRVTVKDGLVVKTEIASKRWAFGAATLGDADGRKPEDMALRR